MIKKKIAVILWGDIRYDGRVRKIISSLKKENHEIVLYTSSFNDSPENYDYKIVSLGFDALYKNPLKNFLKYKELCHKTAKLLRDFKPDIIHCNDLNTLYTGYYYKKETNKNVRVIFDAHELFPEMQLSRVKKIIWNRIEKKLLPYADRVIMPETNRINYFKVKHNFVDEITFVPNYPSKNYSLSNSNLLDMQYPSIKNKKKVLYIGLIKPKRNLENIALAFRQLSNKYALVLIGSFTKGYELEFRSFLENNNLSKSVFIHKPVPNSEVISYINSSDIGIVFYENSNINNYYCASNKLFEFIVLNKPVITNDYPGLIEIVEKDKIGVCVKEISSQSISNALLELQNFESKKNLNYYWETNEDNLLKLYC